MLNVASRVEEMLKLDNISNPQGVCRVLEQEIKTLLENYLVINKEIIVRHRKEKGKNIFFFEFQAEKIKDVGYLPQKGLI